MNDVVHVGPAEPPPTPDQAQKLLATADAATAKARDAHRWLVKYSLVRAALAAAILIAPPLLANLSHQSQAIAAWSILLAFVCATVVMFFVERRQKMRTARRGTTLRISLIEVISTVAFAAAVLTNGTDGSLLWWSLGAAASATPWLVLAATEPRDA